jgi:hypothetical protein
MGIDIRQKGAEAEREVQKLLEPIVRNKVALYGHPLPATAIVQRNQNQSAVGGGDLVGTCGMLIEVKRQEQLSVNTWWQQCLAAAQRNKEHPVLLYRQSGKKWRAVTLVWSMLPENGLAEVRAELELDQFLKWFDLWVDRHIRDNGPPRI